MAGCSCYSAGHMERVQWFEAINCQRPRSLAKVGGISNDCNRAAFPTRNSGPSLLERVLLVFDVVRVRPKEADATFNNRIQNQFNCFRFQTHSGSGLIIIRPIKTAVVQINRHDGRKCVGPWPKSSSPIRLTNCEFISCPFLASILEKSKNGSLFQPNRRSGNPLPSCTRPSFVTAERDKSTSQSPSLGTGDGGESKISK